MQNNVKVAVNLGVKPRTIRSDGRATTSRDNNDIGQVTSNEYILTLDKKSVSNLNASD